MTTLSIHPSIFWFILGVILLILELSNFGLIFIFLGLSACIVGSLTFFLPLSLNMQLFVFLVSAIVSLITLRKWVKSLFFQPRTKAPETDLADQYIGKKATVTEEITPKKNGKVELHGTQWTAKANTTIAKGQIVIVTEKNNLTFTVKKL